MSKDFRKKSSRGFTLVEVLVATTIFSMVVVMSATTFTTSSNVNRRISGSSLIQEKISVFLDQLLGEIRQAKYATYNNDKDQLTIVIPDPEFPDDPLKNTTKIYSVTKLNGENTITVKKNNNDPIIVDMTGIKLLKFEFSGNGVSKDNESSIKDYPFIKVTATFGSSIDKTVANYEIDQIMTLRNFKKVYNETIE